MVPQWHFTSVKWNSLYDFCTIIYIPVGILCLHSIYTTLGLCVRHWSKKVCVYYESPLGYHQNTLSLLTGTPPIHKERDGRFWLPFHVENFLYMACFIKHIFTCPGTGILWVQGTVIRPSCIWMGSASLSSKPCPSKVTNMLSPSTTWIHHSIP